MQEPHKCGEGEEQSESTAKGGKNEGFGEVLADEAPAAAAERGADGEVLLPRGGAGDEQVGDVEAGDEQNADGGGEQRVERRSEVFDRRIEQRAPDGASVYSRLR